MLDPKTSKRVIGWHSGEIYVIPMCFTCVLHNIVKHVAQRGGPSRITAPGQKHIRGTIEVATGTGRTNPPPGLTGYRNIVEALQAFAIWGGGFVC